MGASVSNHNRNSYATLTEKTEITGEFVLVFNKLGRTIGGDHRRSIRSGGATDTGTKNQPSGEGHEQEDTPGVRPAPRGTGLRRRPRRRPSQPGQEPVRPLSAR